MVVKCTAVCLMALSLLCRLCDGQWSHFYRPSPRVYPVPRASAIQNLSPQVPQGSQQTTQISKPLTWHYPLPPQGETIPMGPNQPSYPAVAAAVAINCTETNAYVEVKEDMFGTGILISSADLTLGTCTATGEDPVAKVLIFDTDLQACGSTLSMTNDTIIYSFMLNYRPQTVANIPVVRSTSAGVIVQCHYQRLQNVSSSPVNPYWSPFSAVRVAQEFLYFNMTLMTDDWQYLRPNYQYYMGDMIKIQVSVMQYFHVPLRIYVDSCIATMSPDTSSSPSYVFIDQGCMLDGILTGSASQFMNRTVNNRLRFQLETFMFQGASSGVLYITCHLIATTTSYPIDSGHRACSYINGWREASGVNSACGSCYSGGISPSIITGPGTGSSGGIGAFPGVGVGAGSLGIGLGTPGSLGTGVGGTGSLGVGLGTPGSIGTGIGTTGSLGIGLGTPGSSGPGVGATSPLGVGLGTPGSVGTGVGGTGSFGVGIGTPGSSGPGVGGTGSLGIGYGTPGSSGPGAGGTGSLGISYGAPGSLGTGVGGTASLGISYGASGSLGTGVGGTGSLGISYGAPGSLGTGVGGTGSLGISYGTPGSSGTGVGATSPLGIGLGTPGSLGTGVGGTGSLGISYGTPGSLGTGVGATSPLGVGLGTPGSSGTGVGGTGSFGVGIGTPGSSGTGSIRVGLGTPGSSGTGVGGTGSFGVGIGTPGSSGTGSIRVGLGTPGSSGTGVGGTGSLGIGYGTPGSSGPGAGGTGSLGIGYGTPGSLGTGVGATSPLGIGLGTPGSSGTGVGGIGSTGIHQGTPGASGIGLGNWGVPPQPTYSGRKARDVSHGEIFEWEAQISMGPFQIEEKLQD